MKWCCISICLVHEWYVGFFASGMHPWLSHIMDVGSSYTYPTSAKSCISPIASLVQWLVAMYSAFILDNAMVGCFMHFHKMTPTPTTKNTYPVVNHRLFASPIQSTSKKLSRHYPCLWGIIWSPKCLSNTSWMYFMAIQCGGPAFDMNWLTVLTANAISTLIDTIAYMRDPTPALYGTPSIFLCTFTNSSSESFNNIEFTSNGVLTGLHSSMLKCLRTSSM